MKKMIEGFFLGDKRGRRRLNLKKKYRWYLPEELENKVNKGDIVGVNVNDKIIPFLVDDILKWDGTIYCKAVKVVKVIQKNKPEVNDGVKRYKRLSDEDKEVIRSMKVKGKKLREIAEIYRYSITSIHRIINEK